MKKDKREICMETILMNSNVINTLMTELKETAITFFIELAKRDVITPETALGRIERIIDDNALNVQFEKYFYHEENN